MLVDSVQAHRLPWRWRLHRRAAISGGELGREHPAVLAGGLGRDAGTIDSVELNRVLAPPKPPPPRSGTPTGMPVAGSSPDRLAAWVASRPEGARNGGLFWAACRMAEAGHDFSQTSQLLGDAAQSAGLPDAEAFRTITSAYRIASRLGPSNTRGRRPGPTTRPEGVAM